MSDQHPQPRPGDPAGSQPGYPPQAGYGQQPGYPPQAGYGQQPGYPAQPGYKQPLPPGYAPQQPYVRPPSNGVVSWAIGFIVFAPIPFLGALASGIAMAATYGSQSKRGPAARDNARAAANWGMTFALVSTVLVLTHFVLLFALTGGGGVRDFYPLGIPITLYGAVVLLHIVLVIVGTIRAGSGKVTRVPFAIPFIRA